MVDSIVTRNFVLVDLVRTINDALTVAFLDPGVNHIRSSIESFKLSDIRGYAHSDTVPGVRVDY